MFVIEFYNFSGEAISAIKSKFTDSDRDKSYFDAFIWANVKKIDFD